MAVKLIAGHHARGSPEARARFHREALAMARLSLHGPDHPNVAVSLANLSGVYRNLGRRDEALALAERVLAIYTKAHGPEHEILAHGHELMAVAFLVKKDQRSALESVERGLAIRRKALGDEHYLTLQSMGNVSEMYLRFGRCPEARPLLAQVIRVRELKKIPTLAGALAIQADCDAAEGKLPQAVEGYQRAIALYEAQEGRKAQIGVMRFHLAKALWDLGRRKEARAAALRARDELGGGSDRAEKREALDAWLASHSR